MKQTVIIYHNPHCTKSRQTLALLREHGCDPEIIEYLIEPPSAARVKELIDLLGVSAHDLLRPQEAPYAALGLSRASSTDEIARAIATHPILLERPIVICGKKAAIGRPPERVRAILG